MKPVLIHAFDLEASGPFLSTVNAILSVGASATLMQQGQDPKIVNQFQANIGWPAPVQWKPDTYEWYVTNHKAALDSLLVNQVSPDAAACELMNRIGSMQHLAASNKWNYRIVVDNEFFDVLWVDWFLLTYCPFARPLRESHVDGHYMGSKEIVDVNQRLFAMREVGLDPRMKEFEPTVHPDHTPLRDSLYIAEKYIHYLTVCEVQRKKNRARNKDATTNE